MEDNPNCFSYENTSGGDITYSTIPVPGLDATTVATKVGSDLQFKGFISGVGIIVDETTNPGAITITATGAAQNYTYSTEAVPGVTATVVGTQVGANFGFRPVAGLGDVTVDNISVPGALAIRSNITFSTDPVPGIDATVVDTKVGSDLRFRGLVAGPNVTIDQVSQPGAIVISATGGSPSGQLFQNNTLFVDTQFGNDITGTRERRDLPYQTIGGALADALAFDQIHVFPGNYSETNNITIPLSIHLEDGTSLAASGAHIFSVGAVSEFSVTGQGIMNIGNTKTGFVLGQSTSLPLVRLKQLNITNGTGFNISGTFGGNINVELAELNLNGGQYVQSNVVASPNMNITTTADQTTTSDLLFNGIGTLGNFAFNTDVFNCNNFGALVIFSGTTGQIFLRGKVLNFNGSIAAPGVRYFNIEDTTTGTTQSKVLFVAEFDSIYAAANCPTMIVRSNKTPGQSGIYPVGQIVSKQAVYKAAGFNADMFTGINGDIILRSHDLQIELSSNNTGFNVAGSLTIDCSGTFREINSTSINKMLQADELYMRASDMYLAGQVMSANGSISADTLTCDTLCYFEGRINIDAKISTFTNSVNGFSVNTGPNGAINISGQSTTFVSALAAPVILATSPNTKFTIKTTNLVFNNSGGASSLIGLSNSSYATIDAEYIENMSANISQSKMDVSCSEYFWTNAGGSNTGFRCLSGSTLTFSGSFVSLTGSPNWISNANSTTILNITKVSVFSTGTLFDLLGAGAPPTEFIANIQSLQLSPSTPGLVALSNAQSTIGATFGEVLATNNNVAGVIVNTGLTTTKVQIGYAEIPCSLLVSAAGANIVHCMKCRTFTNNPLIVIGGNGTNEISGNYSTAGATAISLTSLTQLTTIGPSKLFSSTNSITGPGGLPIGVIPSIASTAATGVVINGSLIVTTVNP